MAFNYHLIPALGVQYWLLKQSIQIVTKKTKEFYLNIFFHKVKVSKVYNNVIKFYGYCQIVLKALIAAPQSSVTFTYFILTELASACRCSRNMIMVLKSVTFMLIGGKYVSSVFLSSSTFIWPINQPNNKTLHVISLFLLPLLVSF